MKVVDIAEFYSAAGGGVRTYVEAKLAAAARQGHEMVVIAPGREHRTEHRPGGGRIEWVPAWPQPADRNYRLFFDFKHVHALLDAERPDVVEASSPWTSTVILAAWQGRAARVLVYHSDPVSTYIQRWFEGLLSTRTVDRLCHAYWMHLRAVERRFDGVVVAGETMRARLVERGLVSPTVVPFGVDTSAFSPRLRDPALRAELLARCGLAPEAPLLLGVGRLVPEKRWDAAMRAAHAAGAGMVLVGAGFGEAKLRRLADRLGGITLTGPIADRALLARIYASADALIHGCETETFGLAAAEAMASGLPLVVPAGGGAMELAHPDFAELWRPGDWRDGAAAVRRLLARPRAPMAQAAVEAAARLGTPDEHFRRLFALYAELAARRRSAGEVAIAPEVPPLLGEGAPHPA